jgi:acyl carrier protein
MPDFQKDIVCFIKENYIMGRNEVVLDPDVSLIESGIMDSTGVLELVEFLETTYGIRIEDEELMPENLETITNIVNFLQTKVLQTCAV